MSGYAKSCDEAKYMSFFIKHDELLKNIKKSGINLAIILKRYLLAKKTTIKQNFMREKSIQVFMMGSITRSLNIVATFTKKQRLNTVFFVNKTIYSAYV